MNSLRQDFFSHAMLPAGWQSNTLITSSENRITSIETAHSQQVDLAAKHHSGIAVPGMVNVHSHAFQHAFAGLSEYRTDQRDSFWTWRKLMYEFLEELTPEQVYQIALKLYQKMKSVGYSVVGEFHYLLHQPGGKPYDNINEMADALIAAAGEAKLNICMLPVLYQRGGFDDRILTGGQLRFGSSSELFVSMFEKLLSDHGHRPHVQIGWAIHSLRAVAISAAREIQQALDRVAPDCPIHIHIAEQTAEVEDCIASTGLRPVEFLLEHFDVDSRWCLIHATHMTDKESERVAQTNAVIGVCPTTEANLGDGVFEAERFMLQGGRLAIGSDSHVAVAPNEELRLLEYAQRLTQHRRAVLCSDTESCGERLWLWAAAGGSQATGFPMAIDTGNLSDFHIIPATHSAPARSLDRYLFCPS